MEETILAWIENYGASALYFVPILAFAEACVGLGLFVSGAFLLGLATLLYSNGVASVELISVLAMLGATLGDHAGFYVGYFFGPQFNGSRFALKHQEKLGKAEELVRRYGGFAIFVGRFIPAIRSIIPAVLGVSGFRRKTYSVLDLCACLVWSAALAGLVMGIEMVL